MKASLIVLASGFAAAAAVGSAPARYGDGGPADGPDGWEVPAPPQAAAAARPLVRGEAPDLPPSDWDDDAKAAAPVQHGYQPQGYGQPARSEPPSQPVFAQAQQWASSDVGRHWAASDVEAEDVTAAQVAYGMARTGIWNGNISHTYHIDPHLLADVPDANTVCGTADQIHDCGFAWLAPVCTDHLSSDCVRGVCICTAAGGCDKPTCEASNFECHSHKPSPLAACKSGCLTKAGSGWSCWHPCNMQHEVEDYGAQAARVKAIRATGVCGNIMTTNRGNVAPASTADPALLKDVEHASGFCGSQEMVKTCGFGHLESVCTGDDCYKGVCVCTQAGGCLQPQCKTYPSRCPTGLAQCNGNTCLAVPGTGWSCWHPCNLAHGVEEFGHQAGIVQAIRNSGNCTRIGVSIPTVTLQPMASEVTGHSGLAPAAGTVAPGVTAAPANQTDRNDTTPGLDAGIMLRSTAWPIIASGESPMNAGGSSRRRADRRHQPDHDTKSEVMDVAASWHRMMQGKARVSENGKRVLYGLLFFSIVIGCLVVFKPHRAKKEEEHTAAAHH